MFFTKGITSIMEKTFYVQFGNSSGTAFALDVNSKQYLITASHVIKGMHKKSTLNILHNNRWHPIEVTVVGMGDCNNPETDVAVLATTFRLAGHNQINPSIINLMWGQQVYFCGFPYGLYTKMDITQGRPVPMIKGAIFSGVHTKSGTQPEIARGLLVLDGHNNRGFSGGPVIFRPGGNQNENFKVLGVVSSYCLDNAAVTCQGKPTGLTSLENTGIILCPSITQAIDMIEANPIGFTTRAVPYSPISLLKDSLKKMNPPKGSQ